MNTYKKRNYRKRGYSGRPHRRAADSYHQPLPPEQNRIPYARHTLTKPDVEAVVDALLSGTLTQGREVERFESLLSKLTHSDHAISFSSGTAAIHAALACLKMEPEDEIITSTLNFCAIANMVTLTGARTVLVDCDPNTLTLDVNQARARITSNTKAIFTNNFGGHASDLQALRELCDEHNLLLLEDASHGLGGKYRGHYVGNQADLTCFSFHPSKAITTCEGGAVTTNNRAIAEWLRLFRHHGIQKDSRYFQTDEDFPGYYQELQFQGMNYRLSEIHAALGRSQLTRLDRHIERRRSIAQVYYQKLSNIEELILPYSAEWADSAFHLYPIQLTGAIADKRDALYQDLKTAAIDTQVHYVPVHRMPLYAGKLGTPDMFPNAEAYFSRALSLPLFPDLSYKEIERITELLTRFISKYLSESKAYVPEETAEVEEAMEEASAIEKDAESGRGRYSRHEEEDAYDARDLYDEDDSEDSSRDEDVEEDEEPQAPARKPRAVSPKPARVKEAEPEEDDADGDDSAGANEGDSDSEDDSAEEPKKKAPRRRAPRRATKKVEGEAEKKSATTRKSADKSADESEEKPKARRTRKPKAKAAEPGEDADK